jgi:hypothetical protein
MHVVFVKKITADGQPCRKCVEVEQRLANAKVLDRINRVVIADERNPSGEGMMLAAQHGVNRAPFFIVTDDSGNIKIYTVYFRFMKEVLKKTVSEQDELAEILGQDQGLDYL